MGLQDHSGYETRFTGEPGTCYVCQAEVDDTLNIFRISDGQSLGIDYCSELCADHDADLSIDLIEGRP